MSETPIRLDVLSWRAGRAAGAVGSPSEPPPEITDQLAWHSGYVEGAAWRIAANDFQPREGRSMASDYDIDFLTWSERQANLLRRVGAGEEVNDLVDWDNLAEEISDLGKSLRRDLHNRITTILEHLLKLEASPAPEPRANWRVTVLEQRDAVEDILRDAPSLKPTVAEVIDTRIPRARRRAHAALVDYGEVPEVDIDTRAYSVDEVLGDWFPQP